MLSSFASRTPICLTAALVLAAGCAPAEELGGTGHEDLVALFDDWRAFQDPKPVEDIPDYSRRAMADRYRELATYQRRLGAIDTTGWPVAHQVDYHLVRAEMNGLDFDHRVRRPWARNPAFYNHDLPRSERPTGPRRPGHPRLDRSLDLRVPPHAGRHRRTRRTDQNYPATA